MTPKVLLNAVHFAALKHRNQRRNDADRSPYINHPIEAAMLLATVGGVDDLTTLIGAVLHDTIEDTETTPAEIEAQFGREVRLVVEEVTDDKTLPKAERKKFQVEHAAQLSVRAKLVKIADKISNVREVIETPPTDWSMARRQEYVDWTEQVVAGCRGINGNLEARYNELLQRGRSALASNPNSTEQGPRDYASLGREGCQEELWKQPAPKVEPQK